MSPPDNPNMETNHLLPSGDWEGFYNYAHDPEKHTISLRIQFLNGRMDGSGSDDVGAFSWVGVYDLSSMRCNSLKIYATHRVIYNGYIDENGIWGNWEIPPFDKGGFHIWPKSDASIEMEAVPEVTSEVPAQAGFLC